MTKIKTYDVGNGDMFYILHNSDNFSIIDCNLEDDRREEILAEVRKLDTTKGITRFISTHPDEDHIHGLEHLDKAIGILNFYRVDNQATKADETASFKKYRELRDDPKKSFAIRKGCSRKWMNESDETRKSSGINILWPDTANEDFKDALTEASKGGNCNNICPIVKYSLNSGVTAVWMGDLETEFMESIADCIALPKADILFAPHHGRKSGRPPKAWLEAIEPAVIVVGSAPSDELEYYRGYNTITQNSAGDILFDCGAGKVDVFVSSSSYTVDFLYQGDHSQHEGMRYIGTFSTRERR